MDILDLPIPNLPDTPKIGGVFKVEPEDFVVDEIPLYLPSGEGTHLYLHVRKRDMGAGDLLRAVADAAGCKERDVGQAGTKDKRAVTSQWLSVPYTPELDADKLALPDDIELLDSGLHRNKLKTGHLRANRFTLRVRDLAVDIDTAQAAARSLMAHFEAEGVPNVYGPQRFGREMSNVHTALAWANGGRAPKARRSKRMVASALQSYVFNYVAHRRHLRGDWRRVMDGDLLCKTETGGRFIADDVAAEQERLDRGEVIPMGPMPGPRIKQCERDAAAFEAECLAELGLNLDAFRAFGKLAQGTRRLNYVTIEDVEVRAIGEDLGLTFTLPTGSYATVVLGALMG